MRRQVALGALIFGLAACPRTSGDGEVVSREAPPVVPSKPDAPPGNPTFMGRPIAQTMGYQGAGWLTRDDRDDEENTTLLHEQLGLKPGQTACDLGAGNGYHTLKMARAVAPEGTAVAIDIQQEMLDLLRLRADEAEVANIEYVLSVPGDPKLGEARCDLILLVDVYHELADPASMLRAMKTALTPTGRIALAEFRPRTLRCRSSRCTR